MCVRAYGVHVCVAKCVPVMCECVNEHASVGVQGPREGFLAGMQSGDVTWACREDAAPFRDIALNGLYGLWRRVRQVQT